MLLYNDKQMYMTKDIFFIAEKRFYLLFVIVHGSWVIGHKATVLKFDLIHIKQIKQSNSVIIEVS